MNKHINFIIVQVEQLGSGTMDPFIDSSCPQLL